MVYATNAPALWPDVAHRVAKSTSHTGSLNLKFTAIAVSFEPSVYWDTCSREIFAELCLSREVVPLVQQILQLQVV